MRIRPVVVALLLPLACVSRTVACDTPPVIEAPPTVHSTTGYTVRWRDATPSTTYELQEASSADFSNAVTLNSGSVSQLIAPHTTITSDTRLFYRVREVCGAVNGPYSAAVSTVVAPLPAATGAEFLITVPTGTAGSTVFDFLVPGLGDTATVDDRFILTTNLAGTTVFPDNGALSAGGTTVQFTIAPAVLGAGSHTGRIYVTRTQASGSTTIEFPLTIAIVTPIRPEARTTAPPAGTLLVPAVAHADGLNSRFQSDVRITNLAATDAEYDLTYTHTGVNGTVGRKTTMVIAANETKAFDDVVKTAFGAGLLGEVGLGSLEVRPVVAGGRTIGSSRTYNVTSNGTLGQYIPALPIESFIGNIGSDPLAVISLQQIAASERYRTNLGFVEGIGQPVELAVKLYDVDDNLLQQVAFSLGAFGHRQFSFNDAAFFPGRTLDDGRIEVEVTSGSGKASAYASVLDNKTSDPLLVFPVQAKKHSSNRYVLPGVAELNTTRNFHTDMRIFNASDQAVTISLAYRPQSGDPTPIPAPVSMTIDARKVKVIDNTIPTLWNLDGTGGAVTVTAAEATPLVITGRTYSRNDTGGTYGQFIPAITPSDAIGLNDPAIEVLQLEQSKFFRSNLGLVEVTGADSVTIELSAYANDSSTPLQVSSTTLSAGEFRQLASFFTTVTSNPAFNGRVSIRVTGGGGRVSAYGSVIDSRTEDPTYIPAE